MIPCQFIAKNFGDGRPGRNGGLHVLRQNGELQAIENFLPVPEIVGTEVEIHFDVAQPENRQRANLRQPRHALERDLDGQRNRPLHLLAGPARILRDDLDHRRRRIGISHHIQNMKRIEAAE